MKKKLLNLNSQYSVIFIRSTQYKYQTKWYFYKKKFLKIHIRLNEIFIKKEINKKVRQLYRSSCYKLVTAETGKNVSAI